MEQNIIPYDFPIDKNTAWDGDASTGGVPVAGRRVEEFLKSSLDAKLGEDDIAQGPGNSERKVVSQKAFSDIVGDLGRLPDGTFSLVEAINTVIRANFDIDDELNPDTATNNKAAGALITAQKLAAVGKRASGAKNSYMAAVYRDTIYFCTDTGEIAYNGIFYGVDRTEEYDRRYVKKEENITLQEIEEIITIN